MAKLEIEIGLSRRARAFQEAKVYSSDDMRKTKQRVKLTKLIARHIQIRDQNPYLRIDVKKKHNAKNDVPTKQRGSWPKVFSNLRRKEQHSSHLRKIGACLHQR